VITDNSTRQERKQVADLIMSFDPQSFN